MCGQQQYYRYFTYLGDIKTLMKCMQNKKEKKRRRRKKGKKKRSKLDSYYCLTSSQAELLSKGGTLVSSRMRKNESESKRKSSMNWRRRSVSLVRKFLKLLSASVLSAQTHIAISALLASLCAREFPQTPSWPGQ